MKYTIVDPNLGDQVQSTYRTIEAAEKALLMATRRAKAQLGATARTTLEIREIELTEDECDRVAARCEYQGYNSLRVFTDGTWIAPANAAQTVASYEFFNYTWDGRKYAPDANRGDY
jgi:hypothetical protein